MHFYNKFMFKLIIMAEEEGFEPSRAVKLLTVFETVPFSRTWVFLHENIHPLLLKVVDPVGLEPTTGRL